MSKASSCRDILVDGSLVIGDIPCASSSRVAELDPNGHREVTERAVIYCGLFLQLSIYLGSIKTTEIYHNIRKPISKSLCYMSVSVMQIIFVFL